MEWSDACKDKTLQDLPYKIELNEWGNIVCFNPRGRLERSDHFPRMAPHVQADA